MASELTLAIEYQRKAAETAALWRDRDLLSDHALPEIGRFGSRDALVHEYAWAIPNYEAIEKLVELSPIVEIGAGGGYWAMLIERAGGKVYAYDVDPDPKSNHYIGRNWFPVKKGGPKKVKKHPDATLFICWPDYGGHAAYEAAKAFEGDRMVYIGEGAGGCTGDLRFHSLVDEPDGWAEEHESDLIAEVGQEWMPVEVIEIPQFWGLHDRMVVYQRIIDATCEEES